MQHALDTLEKAAIRVTEEFRIQKLTREHSAYGAAGVADGGDIKGVHCDSQAVTSTMWVFAMMGTKSGKQMMGQLEWLAETTSGKFNSQAIANTLWAFATIGTKPGKWMMGRLERRAEAMSGEFNSQAIANTL